MYRASAILCLLVGVELRTKAAGKMLADVERPMKFSPRQRHTSLPIKHHRRNTGTSVSPSQLHSPKSDLHNGFAQLHQNDSCSFSPAIRLTSHPKTSLRLDVWRRESCH